MQKHCQAAAAARVAAGRAVGCLALQPQWLQPVPCVKHGGAYILQ